MRRLTRYALRDRIRVRPYIEDGPEGYVFGPEFTMRVRWRGTSSLRSAEGRRRHTAMAHFIAPLLSGADRTVQVVRDVRVFPRRVGALVGAAAYPRPGSLVAPFGVDREERHTLTESVGTHQFRAEDQIEYGGRQYQVVEREDIHQQLSGPSFYRVWVKDRR